jgi:DNA repair photolyase
MKHDFEDVEVKRDAPLILDGQLRKRRKPCMISTGAMCDPYIPLENELHYTRQCLEVIEKHGFGVSVLTKSARIFDDLELLKKIHKKARCVVQMTLTTFDEALCRIVEPDVSTTAERFQILKAMRASGIPTAVWLCPVLPFINDTEENLRGILDYCVKAEVKAILNFGFGVTLREGDREYFYQRLDAHFPGVKRKYVNTFGDAYECQSPNAKRLELIFKEICDKNGILYGADKVFGFIREFPSSGQNPEQLSLFEL